MLHIGALWAQTDTIRVLAIGNSFSQDAVEQYLYELGRWWDGQWKNLQTVLRTPMSEAHLQMMLDMVKSIGFSTAALLLFLWTFRRQTEGKIRPPNRYHVRENDDLLP